MSDEGLRALTAFKNLQRLQLVSTDTSERDFAVLGQFTELQRLDLDSQRVSEAALAQLKGLSKLNWLNFSGAYVTDKAMRTLGDIGLLHSLYLAEAKDRASNICRGSDLVSFSRHGHHRRGAEGNSRLQELANAQSHGGQHQGSRPAHLQGMKELRTLILWGTGVDDAALEHVAAFQKLETLSLETTRVSDAGMKAANQLRHLQKLVLTSTGVTDEGIKELKDLKKLNNLGLLATQVNDTTLHVLPARHLAQPGLGQRKGEAPPEKLRGSRSARSIVQQGARRGPERAGGPQAIANAQAKPYFRRGAQGASSFEGLAIPRDLGQRGDAGGVKRCARRFRD